MTKGFVVYALVEEHSTPAGKILAWVDAFHTRQDANEAKLNEIGRVLKVRRATLTLFDT